MIGLKEAAEMEYNKGLLTATKKPQCSHTSFTYFNIHKLKLVYGAMQFSFPNTCVAQKKRVCTTKVQRTGEEFNQSKR